MAIDNNLRSLWLVTIVPKRMIGSNYGDAVIDTKMKLKKDIINIENQNAVRICENVVRKLEKLVNE